MRSRKYKPREGREKQISDAAEIIKCVHALNVSEEMKKKVFHQMIWNITGVDGKYNTRYYSAKALEENSGNLNHEHVCRIKIMKEELLKADSEEKIEGILNKAIGCVVTKEEHSRLNEVDRNFKDLDGWARYEKAEIEVFDLLNGIKYSGKYKI